MSLVPQTRFEWKRELGSAFNTAYSTQLGNVTYYSTLPISRCVIRAEA